MSINVVPLLPHILSLEIPACSPFVFPSIFYYDPINIAVGGMLLDAISKSPGKVFSLTFIFLRDKNDVLNKEIIYQPY